MKALVLLNSVMWQFIRSTNYVSLPSAIYSFLCFLYCYSEYSDETVVCTKGVPPPIPNPPHLSESTTSSLLLTWIKRPGVDREFVLQQEEENTGHGFIAAYTGPEVSYRVDHLQKSTAYKFRVSISRISQSILVFLVAKLSIFGFLCIQSGVVC